MTIQQILNYFKNKYEEYQHEQYLKRYRTGFEWACSKYLIDGVRLDRIEAETWDLEHDSPENKGARDAVNEFKLLKFTDLTDSGN